MHVAAASAGIVLTWPASVLVAGAAVPVAPPVVVTASRLDESASRDVIGAKVITAQDIERSRASSLSELLRSTVQVRTHEFPGSPNPLIDLRGFGSFGDQNTLVLVDGVRVREYEQLTVNWAAIPLASIERIEILPSSSAVLYGGGTAGGTINIVTKAGQVNSRSAYLGGQLASYDTREVRLGGSAAGDRVGFRAQGSHYETDNYRDNQRVRIDSAGADLRWGGNARSLTLKFGGDDQRHGLPGVLSEAQMAANRRQAATPNDFATQNGGYATLIVHSPVGSADLTANVGYRQRETSSSFRVGTPLRNSVDTKVDVWTFSPRLALEPRFGGWDDTLILGADFEDWTFDATSQPVIPGRPHSTQRSNAVYAQHAIRFSTGTTVTLGAREQHVRYDVTDRADPASAGARKHTLHAWDVSGRQTVAPTVNVYAKTGRHFRVPNVNDNFNPFFARVTLLDPQTARDSELGIEGDGGALRYGASVYRVDLNNELFFDPATLGTRNRQPTRRQGFGFEACWQASARLAIEATYVYADATFREASIGRVSITGNRVPLVPRHTVHAGLRWSLSESLRLDVDARHESRSVFDLDERNTFGREIPAHTVADVKLSWSSSGWLVYAGVRNLFDEEYFSYGVVTGRPTYSAIPVQERSMFVSAQYAFP